MIFPAGNSNIKLVLYNFVKIELITKSDLVRPNYMKEIMRILHDVIYYSH